MADWASILAGAAGGGLGGANIGLQQKYKTAAAPLDQLVQSSIELQMKQKDPMYQKQMQAIDAQIAKMKQGRAPTAFESSLRAATRLASLQGKEARSPQEEAEMKGLGLVLGISNGDKDYEVFKNLQKQYNDIASSVGGDPAKLDESGKMQVAYLQNRLQKLGVKDFGSFNIQGSAEIDDDLLKKYDAAVASGSVAEIKLLGSAVAEAAEAAGTTAENLMKQWRATRGASETEPLESLAQQYFKTTDPQAKDKLFQRLNEAAQAANYKNASVYLKDYLTIQQKGAEASAKENSAQDLAIQLEKLADPKFVDSITIDDRPRFNPDTGNFEPREGVVENLKAVGEQGRLALKSTIAPLSAEYKNAAILDQNIKGQITKFLTNSGASKVISDFEQKIFTEARLPQVGDPRSVYLAKLQSLQQLIAAVKQANGDEAQLQAILNQY